MLAGLARDVAGQDDYGDSAARDCRSHRSFQRAGHLGGSRNQLAVMAAFLEQKLGMRLLEIVGTYLGAWNMRGDCENRHTAPMAIEEPVDEMKVAGTAATGADGKLAGDVRFGARGETGDFFVADVDPLDGLLPAHRVGD